ncbi:MAG TPA: biopolymer transporter ExbD [Kofleriaceae bacterium]|nr:biopolymer transporter ExbD [Kofleriaceae bacterium]
MLSAHQVRNKTRRAIKRREEDVEQMEIEGGEINLIPYLDIVTNLMLFLLASVSANIVFGQINTQLPDQGAPPPDQVNNPATNPNDQPLGLAVAVTKDKLLLFSISGLEGSLKAPKLVLGLTGKPGDPCDGGYQCETNRCVKQVCELDPKADVTPVFDYRKLNGALEEIAGRRFGNQMRKAETYQAVLMADPAVPYGTLISVISAMRCKMPDFGKELQTCYLPTADEKLRANPNPVDDAARLYDTTRTPYDPTKHALFSDVVFSGGFR